MLKEATGQGWARYWVTRPILKVVNVDSVNK